MLNPQTAPLKKMLRRQVESELSSNASKIQALRAALKEGEASPIVKDFSFDQINADLDKSTPTR